jgi:DUF1009 family protein
VGLVAGNGSFPIEFALNAREAGLSVVATAVVGETDERLNDLVEKCVWLKVGEVGRALNTFKSNGVKQVAFAGGVRRIRLFGGIKLDLKAITILARCRSLRDDAILREISKEFENNGLSIFSATDFLKKSVCAKGLLTSRGLSEEERADARVGWEIAKEIGRLDVGQTVITHERLVVAVEAIEGTDAAILRAGELAGTNNRRKVGQGCVIVKLCKPQQDLRFDLPTIGLGTLDTAEKAGVSAIVIEAGKTIVLDREEFIKRANKNKLAVFVAEDISDI